MQNHIKIRSIFTFSLLIFFNIYIIASTDAIDHHVVCSLKKIPKNKKSRRAYNNLIHQATYEIKQACKAKYKDSIEENKNYSHRRNSVFFIHFNHKHNAWTLYKPSFIPYDEFIQLIQKIYTKYGLQVMCRHDQSIKITKSDVSVDSKYVSLDEFEEYKKISEEDLLSKINNLENNPSQTSQEEINNLKKIQRLKNKFFWHLQIPTTGLLPGERFDIQDRYKPLAWHFLLWDLAPKKGEGARVAIIDTGISAFNLEEKELSTLYKKNINITMPDILQDYGYNLVSENGLDPIAQIAINFGNYCDHTKFDSDDLMQKLPEMIIDFIKNNNNIQIEQYFIKNAKKQYLNKQLSSLNKEGEEKLKDLLYGRHGISPSGKDPFFHIVNAQEPYNQEVILETLPAPKLVSDADPSSAGHGTFTQGVVNAKLYNDLGISGIAPQAQVIMIKAFKDSGTTNKTTLNAALQRALALKNSIVSMSLKITDEIDPIADAPLKELIDSIDYVVAASGNDGDTIAKEAYPAKFDSVAFDVGAFSYDHGNYSVCGFTQKEIAIGPKFVAPGVDIFSSGLVPDQISDSMYVFMSGTSIAVPVITGFLALMLAEFQDIFTREEILKVIYKFSIKLNHDENWQKYIKLGTPDMRSCLLCLHVLQALQKHLEEHPQLKYSFNNNFDNLVQAIYTINYYIPSCYEKEVGYSLTNDFANYHKAVSKNPEYSISFFTPEPDNVQGCIDFILELITTAINPKKQTTDESQELLTLLKNIVTAKKFNLFSKLSQPAQNRINGALKQKKLCAIA